MELIIKVEKNTSQSKNMQFGAVADINNILLVCNASHWGFCNILADLYKIHINIAVPQWCK